MISDHRLLGAIALALFALAVVPSGFFPLSVADSKIVTPQQTIFLHSDYYQPYEVDSYSNLTRVVYNVTSDNPITVAFMNSQQYESFVNTQNGPISDSIAYQNGTSVDQNVQVGFGKYFLVLYAYGLDANITFGFLVYPNTPLSYGQISPQEPAGIASYGIMNVSGYAVPYETRSNEIVGLANISSLSAFNPNAGSYGDNVAGATLQLNANLVVNKTDGAQDVYWVQNTPDFVTSARSVVLVDNIWNNSDLVGHMSNESVTSPNSALGGAVYTTIADGVASYAYLFSEQNMTYSFPYSFALMMNESVVRGQGVLVQLGYRLFQNGSVAESSPIWYDNVTLHVPNVSTAYYDVSGNATTPVGNFYDAELVFGGEGNLEPTRFINMSASLGLFFWNDTTGSFTSFPSYYSFGGDTGETASGVSVSYSNGIAKLSAGGPNYVYLGNASLTIPPDYGIKLPTPSTSSVTSSAALHSGNSGALYIVLAFVTFVVMVVAAVIAVRRKPKEVPQTFMETFQMTCPICGTPLSQGAFYCTNCGSRVS